MKRWLQQRKILMIGLGILFIILALFFVSSFISVKAKRVKEIYASGDSMILDENGEPIGTAEKPPLYLYDQKNITAIIGSITNVANVGDNLANAFDYFSDYMGAILDFAKVYLVVFVVLLVLYKPGKEYETIEHGSADWASGGEEYKVLSKTEGFILAKEHYLPMIPNPPSGKNGNILVIRRLWLW